MNTTTDTYQQSHDGGVTWTTVTFRKVGDKLALHPTPGQALNRLFDGVPVDVCGVKYRMIEKECEEIR